MKTATTEKPLLAYHGKASIKKKYLGRIQAHRKADQIRSGFYWEGGMGCAVGCILHSGNHANSEPEIGVPIFLTRLLDRLFEGLYRNGCVTKAQILPERFIKAPKPGADLSLVWPKFAVWLLGDAACGVLKFSKCEATAAAIQGVLALYVRWAAGDKPATSEWESARKIAYATSTAAYAASAASAASYAATTATIAAAYTAASYAYAAADDDATAYAASAASAYAATATAYAAAAAAAAAARKQHYQRMANKLIDLMGEAK